MVQENNENLTLYTFNYKFMEFLAFYMFKWFYVQ